MKKIAYERTTNGYRLLLSGHNSNEEQAVWNRLSEARLRLSGITRPVRNPTNFEVYNQDGVDVLKTLTDILKSITAPAAAPGVQTEHAAKDATASTDKSSTDAAESPAKSTSA